MHSFSTQTSAVKYSGMVGQQMINVNKIMTKITANTINIKNGIRDSFDMCSRANTFSYAPENRDQRKKPNVNSNFTFATTVTVVLLLKTYC